MRMAFQIGSTLPYVQKCYLPNVYDASCSGERHQYFGPARFVGGCQRGAIKPNKMTDGGPNVVARGNWATVYCRASWVKRRQKVEWQKGKDRTGKESNPVFACEGLVVEQDLPALWFWYFLFCCEECVRPWQTREQKRSVQPSSNPAFIHVLRHLLIISYHSFIMNGFVNFWIHYCFHTSVHSNTAEFVHLLSHFSCLHEINLINLWVFILIFLITNPLCVSFIHFFVNLFACILEVACSLINLLCSGICRLAYQSTLIHS